MRVNCAGKDWVIIFCRSRLVPREWAARALCAREYSIWRESYQGASPARNRCICMMSVNRTFLLRSIELLHTFDAISLSTLNFHCVREPSSAFLWRIAQIKCVCVCVMQFNGNYCDQPEQWIEMLLGDLARVLLVYGARNRNMCVYVCIFNNEIDFLNRISTYSMESMCGCSVHTRRRFYGRVGPIRSRIVIRQRDKWTLFSDLRSTRENRCKFGNHRDTNSHVITQRITFCVVNHRGGFVR